MDRKGQQLRERLVREDFLTAFEKAMGGPSPAVDAAAAQLFEAVVESSQFAMQRLIENRELGAHEALSGARFALIRGELERIQRRLDRSPSNQPDMRVVLDFEERYRKSIQSVHRHIKPPHLLDEEQRVPIEDLYVPPILLVPRVADEETGEPLKLELDTFVERAFRVVLLGNPGGGKSTFVQNLCVSLSSESDVPFYDGRQITPVRVVLREYSKDRHEHDMSIIDHIEKVANARYQVKPPQGAIEHMLNAGRVILFFDGLDELLITRHRRDIRTDIETFCNLYPNVPVVATSRVVGYDQAPLDDDVFTEFRLGQFRRDDVYLYGRRWYSLVGTTDGSSPESRAERLMQETRDIVDLVANPLMLALVCNLSRTMRELPQSRPKIFEACSEMLFRKWDDQRGFAPVLPFDAHVKPTLEYLANWIYTDEQRQAGVERRSLVDAAATYLAEGHFPTHKEAAEAAEIFITHCTGRAWVFSDTGSTEEGELLYEFTHRTFLEYYAAQYVVSWSDGIDEVAEWLVPRVAEARSDEVTQLVMHILCGQREHARDRLLGRLMELRDNGDETARWNAENFIARSLDFVVPSIAVTDQVVRGIVSYLVKWSRMPYEDRRQGPDPLSALGSALRCSLENRPIVLSALRRALIEGIHSAARQDHGALELAMGLDEVFRRTTMDSVLPSALVGEVDAVGWDAIDASREQIETQADGDFLAAQLCIAEEWSTLHPLVQRFGMRGLFRTMISVIFEGAIYESVVTMLGREEGGLTASSAYGSSTPVGRQRVSDWRRLKLLAEVGERGRSAPKPWMHIQSDRRPSPLIQRDDVQLSPAALFGAICLGLPQIEMEVGPGGNRQNALAKALDAGDEGVEPKELSARMDERDRRFLKLWAERRFCLIEDEMA